MKTTTGRNAETEILKEIQGKLGIGILIELKETESGHSFNLEKLDFTQKGSRIPTFPKSNIALNYLIAHSWLTSTRHSDSAIETLDSKKALTDLWRFLRITILRLYAFYYCLSRSRCRGHQPSQFTDDLLITLPNKVYNTDETFGDSLYVNQFFSGVWIVEKSKMVSHQDRFRTMSNARWIWIGMMTVFKLVQRQLTHIDEKIDKIKWKTPFLSPSTQKWPAILLRDFGPELSVFMAPFELFKTYGEEQKATKTQAEIEKSSKAC